MKINKRNSQKPNGSTYRYFWSMTNVTQQNIRPIQTTNASSDRKVRYSVITNNTHLHTCTENLQSYSGLQFR